VERIRIAERPGWRDRARELGFTFHSPAGETYWDERAYYSFTLAEIEDELESAAQEIEELCRAAVARIVADDRLLERMAVPRNAWEIIRQSWRRNDPSLYGRLDFSYGTGGPAKLLEYNADTPTALYEAAAFQWFWLEDQLAARRLPAGTDQFNSIHERIVARFAELAGQGPLHLASVPDHVEDRGTVDYLADCARKGGFDTRFVAIGDIGLGSDGQFYDLENQRIERLFKLYPWEWMLAEEFGRGIGTSATGFLEPPWRSLLSNKGLLPVLWEMAPNHRNLLPAYFADDPMARALEDNHALKPIYSREGANVTLVADGRTMDAERGSYGAEGYVVQALAPLPEFDANYPVIGAWIVAGNACGIGIREDRSPITKNTSRFVPHVIAAAA
jgi:glutathionylspermidine synthase